MPDETRTQRYDGLFPSQTQEMFDADAASAAEHDWYPTSENWQGSTLFVTYAQDPGRRLHAPAAASPAAKGAAAAASGSAESSEARVSGGSALVRLLTGFVVGIAIVGAMALVMVGMNS
jgi:hypothetical protein